MVDTFCARPAYEILAEKSAEGRERGVIPRRSQRIRSVAGLCSKGAVILLVVQRPGRDILFAGMSMIESGVMDKGALIRRCAVCGAGESASELTPFGAIRPNVAAEVLKVRPDMADGDYLCAHHVNFFRARHVEGLLQDERGEHSTLEKDVLAALTDHELISEHLSTENRDALTFGERLSDRIATFGGSWRFIMLFGFVLACWIVINSAFLLIGAFDPYPFILLNLILSCLAALQAPVIMMSQNRQEAKDRLRSEYDYRINLKAELEIRHLHEKMDHLLKHQWERLVEIQQIQIEILDELVGRERARQEGPGEIGRGGQDTGAASP